MNKVLLLFLSPVLFANAADTCKLNLKADFQMNDACAGTAVSFHNLSTIRYPNATFLWDFGDNTTSADTAPGRIYQVGVGTQTFVVKLVISASGCKDSMVKTVNIMPAPIVKIDRFRDYTTSPATWVFQISPKPIGCLLTWYLPNKDSLVRQGIDSIHINPKIKNLNNKIVVKVINVSGCRTLDSTWFLPGGSLKGQRRNNPSLVFGNPAKDMLMIKNNGEHMVYNLYDLAGKRVSAGTLATGNNTIENLCPGVYFLETKDSDGMLFGEKVVVE